MNLLLRECEAGLVVYVMVERTGVNDLQSNDVPRTLRFGG